MEPTPTSVPLSYIAWRPLEYSHKKLLTYGDRGRRTFGGHRGRGRGRRPGQNYYITEVDEQGKEVATTNQDARNFIASLPSQEQAEDRAWIMDSGATNHNLTRNGSNHVHHTTEWQGHSW